MAVKSLKRAQQRIEVKDLKLNALLEVTLAINENVSKKGLFEIYETTLKQLKIEKLALFTFDDEWHLALNYGVKEKDIDENIVEVLSNIKEVEEVNNRIKGPLKGFDLVIPVYHKSRAVAYLAVGDIINEAIQISPIIKHLNFIQTFTNIIAVAIENKRLADQAIAQERTKKELELASEMQSMMLPTHFFQNKGLETSAYYQSHQKVGGDYYDVIWLDNDRVAFCIADVSGKGISAAILMSNFQANLRVLVKYSSNLAELVKTLNQKVLENSNGERFITFFMGVYNTKTRHLQYVNCGHNPPILKNENKISTLKLGSPGLGMIDVLPEIQIGELTLSNNAILMCYTDGLTEVENEQLEEFGPEKVIAIIKQWEEGSMDALNKNILLNLNNFKKNQPFVDDIALLTFRIQ